jgi:hypothetical protein
MRSIGRNLLFGLGMTGLGYAPSLFLSMIDPNGLSHPSSLVEIPCFVLNAIVLWPVRLYVASWQPDKAPSAAGFLAMLVITILFWAVVAGLITKAAQMITGKRVEKP